MKILIVDDSELKVDALKFYLEDENHEITVKNDLLTACKYIITHKEECNLIFLDMGFGVSGETDYDRYQGINLLRTMATRKIAIPVIVNSSTHLSEEIVQNKKFNIVEVVERMDIDNIKSALSKVKCLEKV